MSALANTSKIHRTPLVDRLQPQEILSESRLQFTIICIWFACLSHKKTKGCCMTCGSGTSLGAWLSMAMPIYRPQHGGPPTSTGQKLANTFTSPRLDHVTIPPQHIETTQITSLFGDYRSAWWAVGGAVLQTLSPRSPREKKKKEKYILVVREEVVTRRF